MKHPSIDPGHLRHRIALQARNDLADGLGGYSANWQLVANVWANIAPVKATQIAFTDNQQSLSSHIITIRWRADCLPEMRFSKDARTFTINTVTDPDETKRYMRCYCEEIK